MPKKNNEAPPIMNIMGLMYFDEEQSKFALNGNKFPEIMLLVSIILFVVSRILW